MNTTTSKRKSTKKRIEKLPVEIKYRLAQQFWQQGLDKFSTFLWGNGGGLKYGFVKTLDELDKASPVKNFPDRPHLRATVEMLDTSRLLLIFKSRQMQLSWLMCAYVLWLCMKPGRRCIVVCKKFESADDLLGRIWLIYENLPEFLRPKAVRKQGVLTFKHQGADSVVQAAAQNPEDVRQYTGTLVWFDEGEFHDKAPEMHEAIIPTTQGNGQFVMTTTPNGMSYFATIGGVRENEKAVQAARARFSNVEEQ